MYEFLDRLIAVALPRVRDFKGVNEKSFDGRGNYTLGVTEQIIFPEIDIDKVNRITGLDITFVTTANSDEEAYELLKELGMRALLVSLSSPAITTTLSPFLMLNFGLNLAFISFSFELLAASFEL